MARDPAFLFYSNDFDAKTKFFSHEQVGKYMRLLIAQHQHGHLTKDQVLFVTGNFDKAVMDKFSIDKDGLFFNERLDFEIDKRKRFTESRRANALHEKSTSFASVKHMHKHMEIENEIEKERESEKEKKENFGKNGAVKLTQDEHSKLVQQFGSAEAEAKISRLENYVLSKGKRYKSHYHTILNWAWRDGEKSGNRGIRGAKDLLETAEKIRQELNA